ncbi:MAG: RNA polymerase sigma factor [Cyclobacteriaceae bacterium]
MRNILPLTDDKTQWASFLKGDKCAFESIFRTYYNCLFQYAHRSCQDADLAHECVQSLFVNLWSSREKLSPAANVKAYLFSSLRRQLCREKKAVSSQSAFSRQSPPLSFSPEDLMLENESAMMLESQMAAALNALPRRQREVLYLRYYEELSYSEISQVMHLNYQSVINLAYRALEKLRKEEDMRKLALYTLLLPLVLLLLG